MRSASTTTVTDCACYRSQQPRNRATSVPGAIAAAWGYTNAGTALPFCRWTHRSTKISDGDTTWRFDRSFLTSNWSCIWGRGCLGILPEPAAELGQGCCSIGAELDGEDEAHLVSALAATLEASRFEHHAAAVTTPPSPRSLTVARTTIAKPSYRGRGVDQRDQFGPSTELADLGIRHPPNKHFPRRSNVPTPLIRRFPFNQPVPVRAPT